MGTKVQIMDMELDLFTQETFHDEIASYLANDVLNVVHMISLDYIDMYDENELVQEVMKEADMVLPGEDDSFRSPCRSAGNRRDGSQLPQSAGSVPAFAGPDILSGFEK